MSIRLYDTETRTVRDFLPLEPGKASIYLCGATVQSAPHIGHLRSGLNFDILRRWLNYRGYDVTFVRNVTDIDDKILAKSAEAGQHWWAHAATYETAFRQGYETLGCLPPTIEPRATGHVPEMIELMATLIERGHAYAVDGDVYFDVRSWPSYGELSGQKLDNMQAAGDSVGDSRKRDPRDFALWKATKPDEPADASWATPWGRGRPGWHLECSAMAGKYLGDTFDIHGGGLDLTFPHHENEIAQSKAAGRGFARYWMHNGWVTMAGEKMSKSLGNTVLVSEMARRWRPVELRYYLGAAHYRSAIEYSPDALDEAATAWGRVDNALARAKELVGDDVPDAPVPNDFAMAMDDDLAVPAALAVLHRTVRSINNRVDAWTNTDDDEQGLIDDLAELAAMIDVLGLNMPSAVAGESAALTETVDHLVRLALQQRQAARERKDYPASDAIRDSLAAAGVSVEDTAAGPRWKLKEH
ncbi:cysteine--tRNA ligase [Jatrophihabitans telluris]|uniref:Cysteine--tRNA ligase n=1 Tax=Jatrophihabitans telluris TaxID=2038343 RepID=A0ABY4QZK5_9ACTN|nr:cysteine--tRNA ligase [Jatrophihabitans telluris]UQX88943.1 cysteine--tRNA ligase [Jatrophihabitans telluris]